MATKEVLPEREDRSVEDKGESDRKADRRRERCMEVG